MTSGERRAEEKMFTPAPKILQETQSKFTDILGEFGPIVLAGGCVRDNLMAKAPKDYDVFILGRDPTDQDLNQAVKKKLEISSLQKIDSLVEWHRSEPFLVSSVDATVLFQDHDLHGIVEAQILISPYRTIEELVDSFDWNVCLFGCSGEGIYQKEKTENIGPGKDLWLNKITFARSTLRRGFRFGERFLMKLRDNDLARLTYLSYCSLQSKVYEFSN